MQRVWQIAIVSLVVACGNDVRNEPSSVADRFPRLTHAQWESTVQDLFHLPEPSGLSATFTPDPQLGRFDNNIARLNVSAGLWRDYQRAAEAVAERVANDPALLAGVAGDVATLDARAFVSSFGLHAFRRPLSDAEVERYAQVFASAPPVFPEHDANTAGVRLVIQTMLQSPFFLYRSELSNKPGEGGLVLNGYEVASRLSYLFWNTMPDDALFAAAKSGALDTPEGIREQASRLFDDERTRAQFRRFHFQAFKVFQYADLDKNTTTFPEWRKEIGGMMQEETLRFLDSVIERDGGIADLLTSRRAFVNADLAKIYGLDGTFGDDYQEVELPPTRAGLLTRAGFLAKNATLDEPDPIHRGVFINLNVLCRPITAPPNIPTGLERTGNTNREKVDSITGEGTCGENCHHTIINPLGFAFEEFDAIGALRDNDHGYPLNTADSYAFADGRMIHYTNAIELSQQLAASPEVHACYATNLLEFMLGRDLDRTDRRVMQALAEESLTDHMSIKELVLSVVASNTFRVRTIVKGAQ